MRNLFLFCIATVFISCQKESVNYRHEILLNNKLDIELLKNSRTPEKALILGYLFVYGNECSGNSDKIKCTMLDALNIENECNNSNIDFLKQWFKKEIIVLLKLQKCPVLPVKFAIQNKIKKLVVERVQDTISITIKVKGMNTSQEKYWDIEQTESFLIENNTFIKIKQNGRN